ncbi:MAG: SRPBCC family protein [Thermocrispum sp.]
MAAKTFTFEVIRSSSADPETLFRMVADGGRWPEWAKPLVPSGTMVATGAGEPLGVGAVRKLGVGALGVKERTTAHEVGRRHAYELITPGPVKNYRAEVIFTPRAGGGTDLRWSGTLEERVPGTGKLASRALQSLIATLATKLVRTAERG